MGTGMAHKNTVITIDGPAGSGKSTVARKLAMKLGFLHVNSGALFRAVGVIARERGVALEDETALANLAKELRFRFERGAGGETALFADNRDVSAEIRSESAGEIASRVAVLPQLREQLLQVQREVAQNHAVVVEGRDSGTIVFPDADFKFYLDADPEVRVKRRAAELVSDQLSAEEKAKAIALIREEISRRDLRDSTRSIAPQVKAEDAILVDTSNMQVSEVIETLSRKISNL